MTGVARFLVVVGMLVIAPRAFALSNFPSAPMPDPPAASPATLLHHRQGLALERGPQPLAAIAPYEQGFREALSTAERILFLYEEARVLAYRGSPTQAANAIDRLVADPAHPPLFCDGPGPSASSLYYGVGARFGAAVSLRSAAHERAGRVLEAFREAEAAHWMDPELRARTAVVKVTLDEPAMIVFQGAVFGPGTMFECLVVGTAPQAVAVTARSTMQTTATGGASGTAVPGHEAVLRVSFRAGPSRPEAAPKAEREGAGGGFVYLAAGLGGGYTNATAHGGAGDGRVDAHFWLFGDDGHVSLLVQNEAMLGVGGDGPLGALHFQLEMGARLPLHDGTTSQGLFLRGGVQGRALLDRGIQTGTLDLPVASAGYALHSPGYAIELGFRGGATLLGGYAVDAGSRRFEVAPTYGPFASLHIGPLHLDGQFARDDARRAPGTPVDYVHGTLCMTAAFAGICAAVDAARADVISHGLPVHTDAVIAGATLGITFDTTGSPYGLAALLRGTP